MSPFRSLALPVALLVAACQPDTNDAAPAGNIPSGDSRPYAGIAANETLRFTGTEPFWGGQVGQGRLIYTTPEDQEGELIEVERFAGRGGISFTGTLGEAEFVMMVTEAACSDGMSDRTYPFTVTLEIGSETRNGCGWTDSRPFDGPRAP